MRLSTRTLTTVACGILLGSAACNDEMLLPPQNEPVDAMFARYVSLGNSITAGFQSGGMNDSLQAVAYPVLVARSMRTAFYVPLLQRPGCPPPYTNVFTGARVGGLPANTCLLQRLPGVPNPYLSNVALPGAEVVEALNYSDPTIIPSGTDVYRTVLLGGRTELQAAADAEPTFVSVWLGSNDVLGAILDNANAGNPALVTPPATFATRYTNVLDSLDAIGTIQGGILVGVPQVVQVPYASFGQAYFAAKAGGALPATFTVGPNCAPSALGGKGDSVLVPFPFGGALLTQAAGGTPVTLTCLETQTVQPAEFANLVSAVTAYNGTISAAATARGWAYLDPNPTLDSLRAIAAAVRPFPLFGQPCTANPFGTAFSCDGFHPSTSTQLIVARHLVDGINGQYSTTVPRP